jgi:hypothetical protein
VWVSRGGVVVHGVSAVSIQIAPAGDTLGRERVQGLPTLARSEEALLGLDPVGLAHPLLLPFDDSGAWADNIGPMLRLRTGPIRQEHNWMSSIPNKMEGGVGC